MRYRSFVSREMLATMAACLAVGAALGVGVSSFLYSSKSSSLSAEVKHKSQRLDRLENLLAQVSRGSALQQAQPAPQPAPLPAAPLAAPEPASQPAVPLPPTSTLRPAARIAKPMAPAVALSAPGPAPAAARPPRPAASVQPAPSSPLPPPVTSSEVRAAIENGNLEGVPAVKAGVKTLLSNGVLMTNGTVIRVGDRFPSGERLLKVDMENGRVITSDRQMLLFFNKEQQQ